MPLLGPTTKAGAVAGELLPSCAKAVPALAELGIDAELWCACTACENGILHPGPRTAARWTRRALNSLELASRRLGETDSSDAALALFNSTVATTAALVKLGRAFPGITGCAFHRAVLPMQCVLCLHPKCRRAQSISILRSAAQAGASTARRARLNTRPFWPACGRASTRPVAGRGG